MRTRDYPYGERINLGDNSVWIRIERRSGTTVAVAVPPGVKVERGEKATEGEASGS